MYIFYRYLLELGRKSGEVPDPNKEAVINQWVEWESTSLQVGFSVGEVEVRVDCTSAGNTTFFHCSLFFSLILYCPLAWVDRIATT